MYDTEGNAREAKTMLGATGAVKRVAAIAVVLETTEGDEWVVASLDSSGGKGIYETVFTGPFAKERALEYAGEKYSGYRVMAR
jgi:hypothetical protein